MQSNSQEIPEYPEAKGEEIPAQEPLKNKKMDEGGSDGFGKKHHHGLGGPTLLKSRHCSQDETQVYIKIWFHLINDCSTVFTFL